MFTNLANLFAAGVHNGGGAVQVRNSVIAGNRGNSVVLGDCAGAFTSGGYNFIGAASGSSGWGVLGDQTGTTNSPLNPLLALPQVNASGPPTCRPLTGSPLLDQGKNSGLSLDQRGRCRYQRWI